MVRQQRTQPPGLRLFPQELDLLGAGAAGGDGPTAEGWDVFWGEDKAAFGTGWEARAEKGPRGETECPPFSLWRA